MSHCNNGAVKLFLRLQRHKVANAFSNTNFTINKVCLGLTLSYINQGSTGGDADNARHKSDSGPIEIFMSYLLCPRYDNIMTYTVNKRFVDDVDSLLRRGGGVTVGALLSLCARCTACHR